MISRTKKSLILQRAINVIAAKGYDGASTRAIAQSANVSQGMLNYYFGSKEAILNESIVMYQKRVSDLMNSCKSEDLTAQSFTENCIALLELFIELRPLLKVVQIEQHLNARPMLCARAIGVTESILAGLNEQLLKVTLKYNIDLRISPTFFVSIIYSAILNFALSGKAIFHFPNQTIEESAQSDSPHFIANLKKMIDESVLNTDLSVVDN